MTTTTLPETMTASVRTGAQALAVEQVPLPPLATDEVLVKSPPSASAGPTPTTTGTAGSAASSSTAR